MSSFTGGLTILFEQAKKNYSLLQKSVSTHIYFQIFYYIFALQIQLLLTIKTYLPIETFLLHQ